MSLIKAYARAQFRPPGDFLIGFRSKLIAATERAQQIALQEAKAIVPVDTGLLRDSIEKGPVVDDGQMVTGTVFATAPYAGYVEFGTGRRGAESPGSDLRHSYTLTWPGQVAKPYLRPALDNARQRVREEFSR